MPDTTGSVKSVFFAALDRPASERGAFLDDACRGDAGLRDRVGAMLRAAEADDPLLDRPAAWHLARRSGGPEEDPPMPESVGRYRVLYRLGVGGMGAVYAAHDTHLDRRLALKLMLPRFAADADARGRFLREARAVAKIAHDNVVAVFEAGERDGVPYIAMQLLEGCSLDEYLRADAPTPAEAARIAREAALGLGAAHEIGLVHRDVKPANLWLESPSGRVKVLDFGLAKPADGRAEVTEVGAVVGTPAYMSPEQARGERLDARSDLFGLGAVLYRMCAGRPPFEGPTTMAVLTALATAEPVPLRTLAPAVPEPLAALAHQMLAKDPRHRPKSAAEVAERLRAVAEAPDATRELPPPPRGKSRRAWLAAAGCAAAMAAVAGVVLVANDKASAPRGQSKGDEPAEGADRRAARWALSLGGSVEVRAGGKSWHAANEAELPERFDLLGVDLERKQVSDAGLAHLEGLRHVVWLHLGGTRVSDAGVAHLAGMSEALWLNLSDSQVSDAGLAHLEGLRKLEHLRVARTRAGDAGLAHVAGLRDLKLLDLWGTRVTDAGLAHVKGFAKLTFLDLTDTRIGDDGLAHVAGLRELNVLSLNRAGRVGDAGLAHVAGLTELTYLGLEGTRVGEGLAHVKGLANLTHLHLSGTRVGDAELGHLKGLARLQVLYLRQTRVSAAGVAAMREALPRCDVGGP